MTVYRWDDAECVVGWDLEAFNEVRAAESLLLEDAADTDADFDDLHAELCDLGQKFVVIRLWKDEDIWHREFLAPILLEGTDAR